MDNHIRRVRAIEDIHDGDTWRFLVALDFDTYRSVWIRPLGLRTAELSEAEGDVARQLAELVLRGAKAITVKSTFTRTDSQRMSFARYLGHVYVDGENVIVPLLRVNPKLTAKMLVFED